MRIDLEQMDSRGPIELPRDTVDVWLAGPATALHPQSVRRIDADRAWQMAILARYTGLPPSCIRLARDRFGKPTMPGSDIQFSVSHSWALIVCAVAITPVGIDVERTTSYCGFRTISESFFSPSERRAVAGKRGSVDTLSFYAAWTCKEAYAKARGQGLQRSFGSFEVNVNTGHLEDRNDPLAALLWTARSFEPADDYMGALVTRRSVAHIRWLRLI
jgi:4'-phosphopantetheinyl transferase